MSTCCCSSRGRRTSLTPFNSHRPYGLVTHGRSAKELITMRLASCPCQYLVRTQQVPPSFFHSFHGTTATNRSPGRDARWDRGSRRDEQDAVSGSIDPEQFEHFLRRAADYRPVAFHHNRPLSTRRCRAKPAPGLPLRTYPWTGLPYRVRARARPVHVHGEPDRIFSSDRSCVPGAQQLAG